MCYHARSSDERHYIRVRDRGEKNSQRQGQVNGSNSEVDGRVLVRFSGRVRVNSGSFGAAFGGAADNGASMVRSGMVHPGIVWPGTVQPTVV